MDQIIPISIITHVVAISETEFQRENKSSSRPTFNSTVSMIDSFLPLPTPTPIPTPLDLTYSEPEPGPVTIFGPSPHHQSGSGLVSGLETGSFDYTHTTIDIEDDNDTLQGLDIDIDPDQSSFGRDPALGIGLDASFPLHQSTECELNEKGILPVTKDDLTFGHDHDQFPINLNHNSDPRSNLTFDSHPSLTYSPIAQFAHANFPLPSNLPYFEVGVNYEPEQPIFSAGLPYPYDPQTQRPTQTQTETQSVILKQDQVIFSPAGLWSPITPTSQLPSQELQYLYKSFPPPRSQLIQVQVPQYWEDHTPTLAPHYPDLDPDLDLNIDYNNGMTRDIPFPFPMSNRVNLYTETITPIQNMDHRASVICQPTVSNFSRPSALGDQVHNLETFGLKANHLDDVHDRRVQLPTPTPTTTSSHGFWKSSLAPLKIDDRLGLRGLVTDEGGGRYDLSPTHLHQHVERQNPMIAFASGQGPQATVRSIHPAPTSYEPIHHSANDRPLFNYNNGIANEVIDGHHSNNIPTLTSYPQTGHPRKIHPRPTFTQTHTHAQSHHPSLSIIQPPPHTYTPSIYTPTTGLYPTTPLTTTTVSSNSSQFYASGSDTILPGVHQLLDDYPLSYPHAQGYGHALSAPPSTIFPNHHSLSSSHQTQGQVQLDRYVPTKTHIHPPALIHPQAMRSYSTSSLNYPYETAIDMEMDMEMDMDKDAERRQVSLSQSPSSNSSLDSMSVDRNGEGDRNGDESRSSVSSSSFESEEGVDEEVLSEYDPNRRIQPKTKGKKGKGENKSKSEVKITSTAKGRSSGLGNGNGNGRGRGMERAVHPPPLPLDQDEVQVVVQTSRSGAMLASGYQFLWEDGVAYTDDAELKQTREVRRRCHNCDTRSPPSWRKSTLAPGKILCNKCGIYERTHHKPRPQQQDDQKLRRNPTPPPSLGGYEPLVYDGEGEGEGDGEESSQISDYSPISQDQTPPPIDNTTPNEDEDPRSSPATHAFWETLLQSKPLNTISPRQAVPAPQHQSPELQLPLPPQSQPLPPPPPPSLPLPPAQVQVREEPIPMSQPYLNPNPPLSIDSRQLPPLKTITSFWNNQPPSTSGSRSGSGSGSGSADPSPTSTTPGMSNTSGNGAGWGGRIGLTPYSRPGSRGSDLRSVSTASLRGVDSVRW